MNNFQVNLGYGLVGYSLALYMTGWTGHPWFLLTTIALQCLLVWANGKRKNESR